MLKKIEKTASDLGTTLQGTRNRLRGVVKDITTQLQQDIDRCSSAIFQELRPMLVDLQEKTPNHKIVMVPNVRFSGSGIAPGYGIDIDVAWHLFGLPTDGSRPGLNSMHIIKLCADAGNFKLYGELEEKMRWLRREHSLKVTCDIPFQLGELAAKAIRLT